MIKRQVGDVVVRVKFSDVVEAPWGRLGTARVNKYTVKCHNKETNATISFPFHDSIANTQTKDVEHGELIDSILDCIHSDYSCTKESYPTFEDFCDMFGYDEDSRRDERTYKEAIALGDKLQSVFSEELVSTFSED